MAVPLAISPVIVRWKAESVKMRSVVTRAVRPIVKTASIAAASGPMITVAALVTAVMWPVSAVTAVAVALVRDITVITAPASVAATLAMDLRRPLVAQRPTADVGLAVTAATAAFVVAA